MVLGQRLSAAAGGTIHLALRPEAAHRGRAEGRETVLSGRITHVNFMGSVIRVTAVVDGTALTLDTFTGPTRRHRRSAPMSTSAAPAPPSSARLTKLGPDRRRKGSRRGPKTALHWNTFPCACL